MNITQQPAPPRWGNETGEDPDDAGGMVDALTLGNVSCQSMLRRCRLPFRRPGPELPPAPRRAGSSGTEGKAQEYRYAEGTYSEGQKHQMLHASDACMGDSGYTNINNNT